MQCNKCGRKLMQDRTSCIWCDNKDNSGQYSSGFGSQIKSNNMLMIIGVVAVVIGLVLMVVLFFGGTTDSSGCKQHEWILATCTEPERCRLCGEIAGEPTGHTWIEATYFEPKTCIECGTTEGTVLVPEPLYLTEMVPVKKNGKIWTRGTPHPTGNYDIASSPDWGDFKTPGYTGGVVEDVKGNRYNSGWHLDGDESSSYFVTYELNGIYATFSGYYGCPAEDIAVSAKWIFGHKYSKYFQVYGDDELLFTSDTMKYTSSPREFVIDVSGIDSLIITYPPSMGPNEIATIFDGRVY